MLLILIWITSKPYVFSSWGLPNIGTNIWKFKNMKFISSTGTMKSEILIYLPLLPENLKYYANAKRKKLLELYSLTDENTIISYDEYAERISIKTTSPKLAFKKLHSAFRKCYIYIPMWASLIIE